MKFRMRLFTVLAFLDVAWMFLSFSMTGQRLANITNTDASAGTRAGATVGAGLSVTIILCVGLPLLLFFLFMAWRNRVGWIAKQRHEEVMKSIPRQEF